jgi:glc operon protein GlcG
LNPGIAFFKRLVKKNGDMMRARILVVTIAMFCLMDLASAQVVDKKALSLAGAQKIAEAAEAAAISNHLKQSIAILDDGGNLLVFFRMDDAQLAGIQMAVGKARTALNFQGPSKAFADRIVAGQTNVLGLPGMLPAEGGLPLMYDGKMIGAIGVSGASPTQDGQTAATAAATLK